MSVVIVVLSLALAISIALVLLLKKDIKSLNRSLNVIKNWDTNTMLTTETFDKHISDLCSTINDILEKQKKIKLASEKSNQELRQAITNISHDLRTPLTSAIGYIQMIKSDKTEESKKNEYVDIVENRLQSLKSLMNVLFDYTRIVERKTALNLERVNIGNVLRDVVSSFYSEFIQKDFNVLIDIPEAPVYVACDIDSFKRITENLIQNALIHGTEQFGLAVHPTDHTIIFSNKVSNIKELEVERLFDRFYTSDQSRNSRTTGLGLAIAKELIVNMDGEIRAYIEADMLNIQISLR